MRVGIVGITGKLGHEVAAACHADDISSVIFGITSSKDKVDPVKGIFTSFPHENIDVLIDCSLPQVFEKSFHEAEKRKIPLLVLSTGHDELILDQRKVTIPLCFASNASYGVFVLREAVKLIAKFVSNDSQIIIDETHHKYKKDAPSGTAKSIAESIKDASGYNADILSKRAGSIVGDHSVTFYLDGEHITISHSAESRSLFGKGALRLAKLLHTKSEHRVYTVEELLCSSV